MIGSSYWLVVYDSPCHLTSFEGDLKIFIIDRAAKGFWFKKVRYDLLTSQSTMVAEKHAKSQV